MENNILMKSIVIGTITTIILLLLQVHITITPITEETCEVYVQEAHYNFEIPCEDKEFIEYNLKGNSNE